jgi:hypothetical protein
MVECLICKNLDILENESTQPPDSPPEKRQKTSGGFFSQKSATIRLWHEKNHYRKPTIKTSKLNLGAVQKLTSANRGEEGSGKY